MITHLQTHFSIRFHRDLITEEVCWLTGLSLWMNVCSAVDKPSALYALTSCLLGGSFFPTSSAFLIPLSFNHPYKLSISLSLFLFCFCLVFIFLYLSLYWLIFIEIASHISWLWVSWMHLTKPHGKFYFRSHHIVLEKTFSFPGMEWAISCSAANRSYGGVDHGLCRCLSPNTCDNPLGRSYCIF